MRTRRQPLPAACFALVLVACSREPPPPLPKWRLEPPVPPAGQADVPDAVSEPDRTARYLAAPPGGAQPTHTSLGELRDRFRATLAQREASRPIDREAARAAARTVRGVRSAVWVDNDNLLVLVDSNGRRSHQTIDELCYQLQPLGDTASVVVNLQSTAARNPGELEILARGCQLAPGDSAARARRLDVLDPEVRAQYEAGKQRLQQPKRRRHDAGDRRALEAIPEM